jgi:hypothetical protein
VQDYYFPTMDSYPAVEPLDEFKKVFFGVFDKEGRETRITSCPAKGSSDREKHLCWFYPRLARA